MLHLREEHPLSYIYRAEAEHIHPLPRKIHYESFILPVTEMIKERAVYYEFDRYREIPHPFIVKHCPHTLLSLVLIKNDVREDHIVIARIHRRIFLFEIPSSEDLIELGRALELGNGA